MRNLNPGRPTHVNPNEERTAGQVGCSLPAFGHTLRQTRDQRAEGLGQPSKLKWACHGPNVAHIQSSKRRVEEGDCSDFLQDQKMLGSSRGDIDARQAGSASRSRLRGPLNANEDAPCAGAPQQMQLFTSS